MILVAWPSMNPHDPVRFDAARTMPTAHDIAALAALLADATRASMLLSLMDGRALTATELAAAGRVSAPTASSHLARLTAAGWLRMVKQGKHRHFRIVSADVAAVIEQLQTASATAPLPIRTGPSDEALRHARTCYDHLAGQRGVQLLDSLRTRHLLIERDGALLLTESGERWCLGMGVDLPALRAAHRPLCRPCLDWSERRMHLAGALGAALLARLLALGHLRRCAQGRALQVTRRGDHFLRTLGEE